MQRSHHLVLWSFPLSALYRRMWGNSSGGDFIVYIWWHPAPRHTRGAAMNDESVAVSRERDGTTPFLYPFLGYIPFISVCNIEVFQKFFFFSSIFCCLTLELVCSVLGSMISSSVAMLQKGRAPACEWHPFICS